MKTVYLGTSAFAVTILERLADSAHRPSLIVTRPDRPAGRGRKLVAPPVAEAAHALGIPLAQPEDLASDEATRQVLAEEPDALVVCAYGAIVREPLLSARTIYNVHPSLLPRWRGAAPIERAIAAGDPETGVSIMALEEGLDSGPVALQETEPIHPDDTYGSLAPRLADLGARLLLRALDEQPTFTAQPEDGITYAEKITGEDRTLDPAVPAEVTERRIRALTPHVGARIQLPGGDWLGVHEACLTDHPDDDQLHLTATELRLGRLALTRVQPAGRTVMDAADWLRGRRS